MLLIMQRQIDILSKELKNGPSANNEVIRTAKRNLRGYAVYGSGFSASGAYNSYDVMNYRVYIQEYLTNYQYILYDLPGQYTRYSGISLIFFT